MRRRRMVILSLNSPLSTALMSNRKSKKLFFTVFFFLVFIPALLWALPYGLRLAAVSALERQGLQAQIQNIDLNLFTGRLAVDGAQGQSESGEGFRVNRALLEWRYAPLLEKRIHLSRLELSGAQLDIQRSAENVIFIAGIRLEPTRDSGESSGWGFGLDQAAIAETELRYRDDLLDETLVVNATSVNDVATWAPSQQITFSATGAVQESQLSLDGVIQPFGEVITVDIQSDARALPLDIMGSYIQQSLQGRLDAKLNIGLRYSAKEGVGLSLKGDLQLTDARAELPDQPYTVELQAARWEGETRIGLPVEPEQAVELTGNGSLQAEALRLLQDEGRALVLAVREVYVREVGITSMEDIQLGQLQLAGVSGLKQADAEALLNVATVDLQPMSFTGQQLQVGELKLGGLNTHIARDKAGAWNFESWMPASSELEGGQEDGQENADSAFALKIDRLEVADASRATIRDSGVKPDFETEFEDMNLVIEALDTSQAGQASPLSLSSKVGRYGQLNLTGSIKPFANSPEADVSGKLSNANLVPLSGFTRRIVGHRISQGTVSSDIDFTMANGKIDALFDLVLNKLKVAGVKGRSQEFEAETGMPLTTALGLMRDRDDNVRLKLPITGDVANPDININQVIQKAVFKAVQVGVLSFYSPLGVVMAADKLVQFASALRFKPVEFAPGSVLLGQEQAAYIETMVELLADRPGVQVTVCGFAVAADRDALAKQVAEKNTRFFGLFKPDADAEAVPDDVLAGVAEKRAELVADFLVGRGVQREQVILCEAAVGRDDAGQPRVEISM